MRSLADTILKVLECDSSGVSLINEENTHFVWPAIAGVWGPQVGGGTPRNFGPCGDVLRYDRPLHMARVERRYTYFSPFPLVAEALLVPFYFNGEAAGTIWAVIHEPPHNVNSLPRGHGKFDREDLRMLESLGKFASRAFEVWTDLRSKPD